MKPSDLTHAEIKSVYSGRPGCACGCRGKHSESLTAIRTVLRNMLASGAPIEVGEPLDPAEEGAVVSAETETRVYIVYTKPGIKVESSHA